MQSASTVCGVSFYKTPREGQRKAIEQAFDEKSGSLNIQLPTGYGKTFTAAGVFSVLHNRGDINRLLYVVPTTAQLDQFVQDGKNDFLDAGVDPGEIVDIGFSEVIAYKQHRNNKSMVYATTIQNLTSGGAFDVVVELMQTGAWMLCVDEYHHYGSDKAWGKRIKKMDFIFTLAMSATPERPGNDSAFGEPNFSVSYRDAVEEKAVKPLECHSYVYRIDAINAEGEIVTYTTDELIAEFGESAPNAIERERIKRQMRWLPKYVSPLVDIPFARLLRSQSTSGQPLQALVGALCCSHAQLVYSQIRDSYPELRVDWCGTGENGRMDAENKKAIEGFCPPKVDGARRPQDIKVDVLVHVGMAGEGLDSVYVSEVIHLNPANINNTNNQECGRASRYLPDVTGYINVDSTSEYAKHPGHRIMEVLDNPGAETKEPEPTDPDDFDLDEIGELPNDLPMGHIFDIENIRVDKGEVMRMAKALEKMGEMGLVDELLNDEHSPKHDQVASIYRQMRQREAEEHNNRYSVEQQYDNVQKALRAVVAMVCGMITGKANRHERSLAGDIKTRINTRKKREIGPIQKETEILKQHYRWIKNFETTLRTEGLPAWIV